jgi:mRNA interferase HicA
MNGAELIRKLRRLAKVRGVEFEHEPRHGKGSHGQLLFGGHLTTVKDPKKEIGPGASARHVEATRLDERRSSLTGSWGALEPRSVGYAIRLSIYRLSKR